MPVETAPGRLFRIRQA